MTKFLKWFGIILGGLLIIILSFLAITFISHDRYAFSYDSGGKLSDNQAAYDITFYNIDLEIHVQDQSLSGTVSIHLNSLVENLSQIELDLIDNFSVEQINNGLEFEHDDNKLMVTLDQPLQPGEALILAITYSGQPVEAIYPPWIGGFVWSEDSSGLAWIGLACQGEGADLWIPCKDHPSDEADSAAISITIPEPLYCASNGLLQEISTPKQGFQTFHWFTGYPINTYNININIGNYTVVEDTYYTEDGTEMPVKFYVLPEYRDGAEGLVEMAIDMLKTYRKYYGEYPFIKEKFGLAYTDYLGMEHQTINAYGNNYKYEYFAGVEFDGLMLHEMGHEWWGNKVTVSDYKDFWIQEGICTYGEALYILSKAGENAYHDYMARTGARIRNRQPIIPDKSNALSSEAYQSDIYTKGAYFMHTMRFLLGDSIFFHSLKRFATDSLYTYKNFVSTETYISLLKEYTDQIYPEFIHMFLYTTNIPEVVIDSISTDTYQISVRNIDFELPMEVAIDDSIKIINLDKSPIEIKSHVQPLVDPKRWYYKNTIRKKSAKSSQSG
jgi:aminopeptidase N